MPVDAKVWDSDPRTAIPELLLLAQDSLEVARLVSSNPSNHATAASVLSGRRNARIDGALASSASTPVELRVHLAGKYAEFILANPAFEFALPFDPSMMTKIPDGSLRNLAGSESVDPRCPVLLARLTDSAPW
jgi:hypothetical protein